MERIEQLAFEWAAREAGLVALAVVAGALALGSDFDTTLKIAALGFSLGGALELFRVHQIAARGPEATEIWVGLKRDERPPRHVAHKLIVTAGTRAFCQFGLAAARLSIVLWAVEIGGAVTGVTV